MSITLRVPEVGLPRPRPSPPIEVYRGEIGARPPGFVIRKVTEQSLAGRLVASIRLARSMATATRRKGGRVKRERNELKLLSKGRNWSSYKSHHSQHR